MIRKIGEYITRYGLCYAVKKIIKKIYTLYILGPLKINPRLGRSERKNQENVRFQQDHLFSILVPLYNTPEFFLEEMLQSVIGQTYSNWQLCLVDGSDAEHHYIEEICQNYKSLDGRVCYHRLEENKGIAHNTNQCIAMAEGDYIALLDHDDLLHPSALYTMMQYLEKDQFDLLYTDEATFQGRHTHLLSVHYKPDFYIENLRAINYICHFTVFRKELLAKSGLFRKEYDGSQDYDLILRLCENADKICHIPKVLYFWRAHSGSVAFHIDDKKYAIEAGMRAVKAHLERCRILAEVLVVQRDMPVYNVKYELGELSVTDIQILKEEDYKSVSFERLSDDTIKFILLLKNGYQIPTEDVMECMLRHMVKPEVAAVTAKIVDRNEKIISADVKLNSKDGIVRVKHLYRGDPSVSPGYMNQLLYAREIPVICNGCMLVRKGFVLKALEHDEDIFDLQSWLKWSIWVREQGYELINETRTEVISDNHVKFRHARKSIFHKQEK